MRYLSNVATLKYFPESCTGCGQCAEVCPHGVFVINGKKAAVTDKDLCMECGACQTNCAYGAISVNSGVGCAGAVIKGLLTGTEECGCSAGESEGAGTTCC